MSMLPEIVDIATIGLVSFAVGYAVRSYVSRMRRLRHQMMMHGARWPLDVPIAH